MSSKSPPQSRRILLTRREAAESLGVSVSHFQRHVQPELPCVYSGQLRLYRPADLERWAEREATLPDAMRGGSDGIQAGSNRREKRRAPALR
jgi:hypothetical protein